VVPDDPDDITVEYVQAVIDELDSILVAGYQLIAQTRTVDDPNVQELFREVYADETAQVQLDGIENALGVENVAEEPRHPSTTVLEVLSARSDCVTATADRDLSPLVVEGASPDFNQPFYLTFVRSEGASHNPTPWVLGRAMSYAEDAEPEDPCVD